MRRTELSERWTVRATGGPLPAGLAGRAVPAAVPGYVTTDLLAAGLVPDPYLDDNEATLAWIGRSDWTYATDFELEALGPDEHLDLAFDGLDTVATVVLNGTELGRTFNMHRSYRFEITGLARAGTNHLEVHFAAPVPFAEAMSDRLGERPYTNTHPFNAMRKMACSFGWDWGPDLASCGIWRPVRLERWRTARLATLRPVVEVLADGRGRDLGMVTLHVEVERAGPALVAGAESLAGGPGGSALGGPVAGADASLAVRARVGTSSALVALGSSGRAVVCVEVADVERWWPAGYGAQPLYELEVELLAGAEGAPIDSWRRRVGFRELRLDTTPDETGTPMRVMVNGVVIAVRGANWIPDDCFPSRVTRDRYAARLAEARAANVNLLRVWGGGIYESEDFYDLADEAGIVVWQDFLFACAAYAEEEPLRSEVLAEATEAVTRLAPHPSLAVWSGCNENLWGYEDWGWRKRLAGRSWGSGYYYDLLPSIVARLDPTRPYIPGSPTSFRPELHPNDVDRGPIHVWDVWNERDYLHYRSYRPRFVSELGFQGPPAWSTLTRALHDEPLRPDAPGILAHQKAASGMAKLAAGIAAHLREPTSFEDWHWATSLNQARAVTTAVEWWRSLSPRCDGIVVWQLNDCWPVISWSAIDGDGRRKPLWYALRRSYSDRLLTIQPRDAGLALMAVNDGLERWEVLVAARRVTFDGAVLAAGTLEASVAPGTVVELALSRDLATPEDAAGELLVAGDDIATRATWFFAEDKDSSLPEPELDVSVEPTATGYRLLLSASSVQRDICLLADKLDPDALVDDMLVTLLAGETVALGVRSAVELDPARLVAPEVLRSANQLCHPPASSVAGPAR